MGQVKEEAHVVEIPVNEEQNNEISGHPLTEMSQSSGHLLLLKLWQREEGIFGRRIGHKATRIESGRSEIFHLCCCFFLFHAISMTLLFTAGNSKCKKWWISTAVLVSTSSAFVLMVQMKLVRFWKARNEVERERGQSRALTRLIQELRMKGPTFDLSRETPGNYGKKKKMKSSSVQIKWKPITWCCHYLVTICLVAFAALAIPASNLILCAF